MPPRKKKTPPQASPAVEDFSDLKPSTALLGRMISQIPTENFIKMLNKSGLPDKHVRRVMHVYRGLLG